MAGDGRRVGCKGTISKKLTHVLSRVHVPAAPAVSFGVDSLGSAFPVGGLVGGGCSLLTGCAAVGSIYSLTG